MHEDFKVQSTPGNGGSEPVVVEAGKGRHSKYTPSNLMVATFSKEVLCAYLCLFFPFLTFF